MARRSGSGDGKSSGKGGGKGAAGNEQDPAALAAVEERLAELERVAAELSERVDALADAAPASALADLSARVESLEAPAIDAPQDSEHLSDRIQQIEEMAIQCYRHLYGRLPRAASASG
jgi:DNA repair ATPase RecN